MMHKKSMQMYTITLVRIEYMQKTHASVYMLI